jgi:hypothetical protein
VVKKTQMKLSAAEKQLHQETIKALHGPAKRRYMARVAQTVGRGGPTLLQREPGWSRTTIRKGSHELRSGLTCVDDYPARGRSRAEAQLPNLPADIRALADQHSQTDPSFQSTRLYLRLSAASVQQQLIEQKGYSDATLPSQVTPLGVFLPQYNELFLFLVSGPLTADTLVDCVRDAWALIAVRFPTVQTLMLNLDNGPENHSRRTQSMHRLTALADEQQLSIALAYYPSYHSKDNPVERVWGVLEQHWNGALLDSLATVVQFAKTTS